MSPSPVWPARIKALEAENERLKELVEATTLEYGRCCNENARLRAERTEYDCRYTLGRVADSSGKHCRSDSPCMRCEIERLQAENKQLRLIRLNYRLRYGEADADCPHLWEQRRHAADDLCPLCLEKALAQIADIASGSTTVNSLPHIARIARALLKSRSAPTLPSMRCDGCDNGVEPGWLFCAYCGEQQAAEEE